MYASSKRRGRLKYLFKAAKRISAGPCVLPLSFLSSFFDTQILYLPDDQKYTRGLIVGQTPKIHADISPTSLK